MNEILLIYLIASFLLLISLVLAIVSISSDASYVSKVGLNRIKTVSGLSEYINITNENDKISFIKNLLLINGITLRPFDFLLISFLFASIVSVLFFLSMKMASLSLLILLFCFILPTVTLNITAIKKQKSLDAEVVKLIKLMKERAILNSNVNLLFRESVDKLDDSTLKKMLIPICDSVFNLGEPLHIKLQDLGFALNNENLISLAHHIFRNREDGTNIKNLLVKLESIIDIENEAKIDDEFLIKPHIRNFIAFVICYFAFVFGVKNLMPTFYAYFLNGGFSLNLSASMIFLILDGLVLFLSARK